MHSDTRSEESDRDWEAYIERLNGSGCFRGGSAMAQGHSFRKGDPPGPAATHLVGYMRIEAPDLESARAMLEGNPTFEVGGTVEIHLLPEGP